MSRKNKKRLIRIIISSILFIPLFIVDKIIDLETVLPNPEIGWILPFILYFTIYILISYDILIKAFKNIIHGQVFDENFLMIIATIGAFAIREFPEAVAVMLFYQIGEFFQDLAVGKSRREIASLMDIRAEVAHVIKSEGSIEEVDPKEVEVNAIIRILPGEKVPLDGVIVKGSTTIDSKSLTGESLPQDVSIGDSVTSGTINIESSIDVEVKNKYEDSAVNKILELVQNATNLKSKQEKFITKFAKWYTPIVVISAILLMVIGGAITTEWNIWISRSLNFLVVSCPCAIVISVPLSFFTSIGRAAKFGILIKGSMYLENFNQAKNFVFDKTGTLTKGNFVVSKIIPESLQKEIINAASICESQSTHPIALSIKKYAGKVNSKDYLITNIPGKGIVATKGAETYYTGNHKLLDEYHIAYDVIEESGTVVYVASNNGYLGAIIIKDEIKENAKELMSYFKSLNIKTVMLTGDNEKVAKDVSNTIGIDECHYSLLPQDKVTELDQIINNKEKGSLVAYVGDGINDAPSLMRSDIGISLGGVGSDVAIEASDIVLMNDNLDSLLTAKKIARKTMFIVRENIYFAIFVKVLILVLSAFGIANIWLAVFGDVGVALLCVLNALRSGKI